MHISALAAALLLLALQETASRPASIDFSKLDRKITSEPKYVAAPRYALLLVGAEGRTRIWMAMDKSKPRLDHYDVLYFDVDGDGKLGEEGERFTGSLEEGRVTLIKIGKVEFPEAKLLLENVQLSDYPKESPGMTFVSFRMNGKVRVYGGYGTNRRYLQFAESAEQAPVLHADPWGTLAFFLAGPDELKVGERETVMLYVGTRGSGNGTFTAVDEDFLDLEKDKIFATLIAKDAKGKEVRQRAQLKEHCWGVRYEGPVRVPSGAVAGVAILRVELESSTGKKAEPAEFNVIIK